MSETAYTPRLREQFDREIRGKLTEQFGYENVMQVPRLDKVVLARDLDVTTGEPLDLRWLLHRLAEQYRTTWVFAVDGRFHDALRASVAATGAASISAGVEALAADGAAQVVDVGDAWWLDVDDPRALDQAEAATALSDARPRAA